MCGSDGELERLDLEEYLNRDDNDECKDQINGINGEDELLCV